MMRKLLAAGMAAATLLTLGASSASAKPAKATAYSYTATIDCGSGPVVVGSTDDLFAPLVDLRSGKKYKPIAWSVVVDGRTIEASLGTRTPKHAVDCSYDDGVATGTVTVKKA